MIGFDSMVSHCLLMGRKEVTTLMYVYIYIYIYFIRLTLNLIKHKRTLKPAY